MDNTASALLESTEVESFEYTNEINALLEQIEIDYLYRALTRG
jgi:hypothetical protein